MASGSRLALRRVCSAGALLLALAGAGGCGTTQIPQAPFRQMSAALVQVRSGADAALSAVYVRSRDRFVSDAAEGDLDKLEGLVLERPQNDPFGWRSPSPPLFLSAAQFRDGVYQFNTLLIQYAGFLERLASENLIEPQAFDDLAKDLNDDLAKAMHALQPHEARAGGDSIALFSTVAAAGFRAYLVSRQRSQLVNALRENEQVVRDLAESGARAVRLTATALRSEYDLESDKLADVVLSQASPAAKLAAMRSLVDCNDRFMSEVAALKILHTSYRGLPAAHAELLAAVRERKSGTAMIQEILSNGRDLHRRYRDLARRDRAQAK